MKPAERVLTARLLRMSSDEFSNHGCNDFELPDTPENRAILLAAHDGDYPWDWPTDGKPLFTMDWLLMSYLSRVLERGSV